MSAGEQGAIDAAEWALASAERSRLYGWFSALYAKEVSEDMYRTHFAEGAFAPFAGLGGLGLEAELRRLEAAIASLRGTDLPRLTFEPGRSLVGTGGTTLYTVGTTKTVHVPVDGGTAERRYISVDGGMSDNARPALYEADYCARLANRDSDAAPALARVVGSHCESGDVVVDADWLPADTAPGDLLAVPGTGAYCFSLSNHYNYFERPAVVAVRDGASRTLVRRVTIHDLLALDTAWAGEEH